MLHLDEHIKVTGRRGTWKLDQHESFFQKKSVGAVVLRCSENDCETAISVANAYYNHRFGLQEVRVLSGLSMNVAKGSIYGLTGSSGCGKTTLISCILGIRKIQSGDISLFGQNYALSNDPSLQQIEGRDVGYMPQDVALYEKFSVIEMLLFFGRLYGIPYEPMEKEAYNLLEFLELSHKAESIVEDLSGGQKRRVSLAIALIHSPKLLILDEPTVGMDPLLRAKIWGYLKQLVKTNGTTVLVTTHYVEELRKADRVGIMVDGRITVEDEPAALLRISKSGTLHDAILAFRKDLSLTQQHSLRTPKSSISSFTAQRYIQRKTKFTCQLPDINVHVAKTLTWKNIKLVLRNLPMLIFLTCVPSIQQYITLINGDEPTNIKFGVVNEELVANRTCSNFKQEIQDCNLKQLGCYFTNLLSPDRISLIYYNNEDDAVEAIRNGFAYGYIHFPANFSDSLADRALSQHYNGTVDDSSFYNSIIKTRFDQSSSVIYYFLQKDLLQSLEIFMTRLFGSCLGNEEFGSFPFKFKTPVFGNADRFLYSEYCSLGLALTIILCVTFTSSGVRLTTEKSTGMHWRLSMSGVKLPEIIIAHFISEWCILLFQATLVLAMLVWRTPPVTMDIVSIGFAYYQILFAGCTGILLGFLFGSILSDSMQLSIVAITFIVPNICVSGMVWPLEALPACLQYVVPVLPCTLTTDSLRWVWNRGVTLTHPKVWPGIGIFPVYSIVVIFCTFFVYKFKITVNN